MSEDYKGNTGGKPFEPEHHYVKVHNAIMDYYTKLPDFKATEALAYITLMKLYNTNEGYAYPETWDLMSALHCSESKVTSVKKVLKRYGLIETERHPVYGNDVYFVYAPITDRGEFFAKYPEAKEYDARRKTDYDRRMGGAKERKERFLEKVRIQREGVKGMEESYDF